MFKYNSPCNNDIGRGRRKKGRKKRVIREELGKRGANGGRVRARVEGNISLACGRRESGSRAFGGPQVVCSFGMCSLSRTQIFPASVTSLHSDRTVVGSVFVCISCSCHF